MKENSSPARGSSDRPRRPHHGSNRSQERPARDRGAQDRPPRSDSDTRGFRDRGEPSGPEIDADVTGFELGRDVSDRLRTLSKTTASTVAQHLVMVHRLLWQDPDLAYQHARAAAGTGSRVDVVREALGFAAYARGEYAEALRELRTARRLGGGAGAVAVMADCERGLGRPERALAVAEETDMRELERDEVIELGLVVAGARMDLGQPEAALVYLGRLRPGTPEQKARIESLRADVLEELGRAQEATQARATSERLLAHLEDSDSGPVFTDLEGDS